MGLKTNIPNTNYILVTEDYVITIKPEYDTSIIKQKNSETLIQGEHIDWIWINQVWGGLKVGPNRPSFYGNSDYMGLQPIYLNIGPVKFQFKGDYTLYGCKLPVEGSVFTDRNSRSVSMVDKMKPFQIGYNLVNNQIADILVDELGTVIMLDHNALPKHSAGEDWGKNNYAKAYVAMKDFQILPLDTSISNTENALGFNHYQVLNLEASAVITTNSFRAPIFYDSDNTGYYVNPNSTSNFYNVQFINGKWYTVDNNNGNSIDIYVRPNGDNTYRWRHIYGGTSTSYSTGAGGYGIYCDHLGGDYSALFNTAGYVTFPYSARSPIFYDSANTGMYFDGNATGTSINVAGSIVAAGNVTAYSDIRLKTDVAPITNAIDKVKQINGVTYTRKENNKRQTGVIAQDVLKVLPEAVEGSEEGMYSVAYGNMVGLLIEAIKEQQSEIDELKALVKQLLAK